MRKNLLALLFTVVSIAVNAQWSAYLTSNEGLPGIKIGYEDVSYYEYVSPILTPGTSTDVIRITVVEKYDNQTTNGNLYFALSELRVLDASGNLIGYTPSSNADHNTLYPFTPDGDGLYALQDDDIYTYFHSMWQNPPVTEYHYIELKLERALSSFQLEWSTRFPGDLNTVPSAVGVTLGTDFKPESVGSEFQLGSRVTTIEALKQENKMFVIKSNSQRTATNNGTTYTGSGPIYMQRAEQGNTEPSLLNIAQFIPNNNGEFIIYWPKTGYFMKSSTEDYNGKNGWQYSTKTLSEAALIKIASLTSGDFEFSYDGPYDGNEITVYVSGELRDGVESKMKIFTLDKKQALERGDYNQGYALPAAFNWTIYEAVLDDETVKELSLSLSAVASATLTPLIDDATSKITKYGDFDGNCTNDEKNKLNNAINKAILFLEKESPTIDEIEATKKELIDATVRYFAVKLNVYEKQINNLLNNSKFSTAPYEVGTYPVESRTMLQTALTTISNAKASIERQTEASLLTLYTQTDNTIKKFNDSLITNKEEEKEPENETVVLPPATDNEECIYIYLKSGGVDAFAKATMSEEQYEENGTLHVPLKSGEVLTYTTHDYDSCTTTAPKLPYLTSFKFNNKYNHNLFVDVIADTIKPTMRPRLNSIGKWLTPSFNMSEESAVAYVDSTQVVSKETHVDFAEGVKFVVTYPGYNKLTNVKIQEEIWTTPGEETREEIKLTADMLTTNKPSTDLNQGLGNLLDNNPATIFHSTWGSANNATINLNCHIIIDLPTSLENLHIYYRCREVSGYNPKEWQISVSNDKVHWTLVRTLTTADGMPLGGALKEYTSPLIEFGGKYQYLKIEQTQGEYSKNHLAISELHLYKIAPSTEEPEKIQDAIYATRRIPFGSSYNIEPEWLTDKAISVPRIDVNIDGGQFVTSKDYYLNANLRITGYGTYDDFEDSVQIKGRGNSTWSYSKKPYRLKFSEKVKPFGLTKGKSWVLLANAQQGALLANAIGMEIGHLNQTQYTNHIVPVELYMNGRYMGNYMFTEKVGMANNSVDVDEDFGYLLELVTDGDEVYQFNSNKYRLPVNIKEPDLLEYAGDPNTRFQEIMNDFHEFESALYSGREIDEYVDVAALARFVMVNQFIVNQELGHPKSVFLWKEDLSSAASKIIFGPVWDFDWGFGYENTKSYFITGTESSIFNSNMFSNAGYRFFTAVTQNESFKKHYYKEWKKFVDNNRLQELQDYIEDYYNFAKGSFENNYREWGDGIGYDVTVDRAKEWLKERQEFIMNNIDVFEEEIISPVLGDVNCNYEFTIYDLALLIDYLNGTTAKEFSMTMADINNSGTVDSTDAMEMEMQLQVAPSVPSLYYFNTPMADARMENDDIIASVGDIIEVPVNITGGNAQDIVAMQMDIKVPANITLTDVTGSDRLSKHQLSLNQIDDYSYRVVVHSESNDTFLDNGSLMNLSLSIDSEPESANSGVVLSNILVACNNQEMRINNLTITPEIMNVVTSVEDIVHSITGGDCLTIALNDAKDIRIYSLDGRLVRELSLEAGTTTIELPAGVYVVENQKILIR